MITGDTNNWLKYLPEDGRQWHETRLQAEYGLRRKAPCTLTYRVAYGLIKL